MIAICLVWGLSFIIGKIGVMSFPPIFFTGLRFALLAILLLPYLRPQRGQMVNIVLVSLVMGLLYFALLYGGLYLAENMSLIAVAVQLNVPFAALLSTLFLGEQVGWRRWFAIALAFFGVMLIGFDPLIFGDIDGLMLVLLAAFCNAIGMILMRRMRGVGVFQLQAWIAMLSWPTLFAVSFMVEGGLGAAVAQAGAAAWGAVLFAALGAGLVGHAGMFYLLQRYEVSQVAPLTLLAPLFGVLFGVSLWGDEVTWRMGLGGSMTLLGVLIIALRKKAIAEKIP